MTRLPAPGDDTGSAVVEFLGAALLLLVPLVYLVLVLGSVQAAAFAADGAAREAVRALVTGPVEEREARAVTAVGVALADQGVDAGSAPDALRVRCTPSCDEPGATVTAEVELAVPLIGAPRAVTPDLPPSVRVSSVATGTVEPFAGDS